MQQNSHYIEEPWDGHAILFHVYHFRRKIFALKYSEYLERHLTILLKKPLEQHEIRFRLMRRVKGELPKELIEQLIKEAEIRYSKKEVQIQLEYLLTEGLLLKHQSIIDKLWKKELPKATKYWNPVKQELVFTRIEIIENYITRFFNSVGW